MVNFLLGQQSGYTKHPCFTCLWDSWAKQQHWIKKCWPTKNTLKVGEEIIREPLVAREKIILPPLHIKIGLMKQCVKALDKNGGCFKYVDFFLNWALRIWKRGLLMVHKFVSSSATQILQETRLMLSFLLRPASSLWLNFLGNRKAPNYIDLVEDMFMKYQGMGANMSTKVHYLRSHLDSFPESLCYFSEKQGGRFHQDMKVMEDRYQGRWDIHVMADCCWCLQRDCPNDPHHRTSYKQRFQKWTEIETWKNLIVFCITFQ